MSHCVKIQYIYHLPAEVNQGVPHVVLLNTEWIPACRQIGEQPDSYLALVLAETEVQIFQILELAIHYSQTTTKQEQNKDVQRIVYRCLPCFTNRFFAVQCSLDLRWGSGFFDEHKGVFRWKKEIPSGEYVCVKIDGNQRTVYSSTFAQFLRTIFCSAKKVCCSLFVLFANSE